MRNVEGRIKSFFNIKLDIPTFKSEKLPHSAFRLPHSHCRIEIPNSTLIITSALGIPTSAFTLPNQNSQFHINKNFRIRHSAIRINKTSYLSTNTFHRCLKIKKAHP